MDTKKLLEEFDTSPLNKGEQAGLLWTRFAPEMEARYIEHSVIGLATLMRLAMVLALLLVSSFTVFDRLLLGGIFNQPAFLSAAYIACPALLLCVCLGYVPRLRRHLGLIVLASMLSVGAVFLWVFVVMGDGNLPHARPYIYEAMILYVIFAYFFSGLRFLHSTIVGTAGVLGYVLTQLWVGLDPLVLWYTSFFLIGANVMGILGRYAIERLRRREFIARELLNYLAERDPLTNAVNRRALEFHLGKVWAQAAREGRGVGVMLVDLDEFKQINDQRGHQFGDQCLVNLAQLLANNARRPWDMTARYGGDEFVVFWYDISAVDVQHRAENVLQQTRDRDHGFTVSIGVAHCIPKPGRPVEELLRTADRRMYQSKRSGRNRVTLED